MKLIGFLNSASENAAFARYVQAFHNGLKESGYVQGQNVEIISKWADGAYKRLFDLAAELVESGVDIIATTGGTVSALAALEIMKKKKKTSLPLLFISGLDPAKAGLLKFGNATGVNVRTTESAVQRMSALRRLVPKAGKAAVLLRPGTFVFEFEKALARKAKLIVAQAETASDVRPALAKAVKQGAGALIVCADPFFTSQCKEIVSATKDLSLPAGFPWRQYAEEGGLMSFGPKLSDAYFQVGAYAGMILKGIKPDALRVQAPKDDELELVVNGTTARTLKVEIPKDADRRIEII